MIEKIGHIKNPLTVIAMFAGLAEVSGTIVLPFIDKNTQTVFVWFLMVFPCLLVSAFFGTLIFKHVVLYAPSDYRDDKNFSDSFRSVKPSARSKKISDEISEESNTTNQETNSKSKENKPLDSIQDKPEEEGKNTPLSSQPPSIPNKAEKAEKAFFAENFAIAWLEEKLNVEFQRGARLKQMPRVVFDAISVNSSIQYIVEVKYLTTGISIRMSIELLLSRVEKFSKILPEKLSKNIILYILIVVDNDVDIQKDRTLKSALRNIEKISHEFDVNTVTKVIKLPY